MKYPDAGFRLLSLYRYWNIIHYYFPYKNLIEEDWNSVLTEFLPKFINASHELDYKLAVLTLIARINDTHANIWSNDAALTNYRGNKYAPLKVDFIENKAVVTQFLNQELGEATTLKFGDIIENINGKSVEDVVRERLPITPASNYPTQLREIARDLLRTNDTSLTIGYKRDGIDKNILIDVYSTSKLDLYKSYQKSDTCFKFINSDIAYLYPGRIKNDYLPEIMSDILKSKGLIIDFRCYPSDFIVFSLGEYLQPNSTEFARFSNGNISTPGLFTMTKPISVGRKNKDYYKGKVVIIVNESTQSSAEYHSMALRVAPGATVIGSTTAGADGNVSPFMLPGGIRTMISGIGVYYPDGGETQRIGIVPDIEVKPTIQGITNQNDELLEKAIEIINEKE